MWTDEQIKGKILHKLARQGKFTHSHTAIEHLQGGFAPEMRGRVKSAIASLIREGILLSKPTSYGVQVSIDVRRRAEILGYIDAFLEMD